MSVTRGLFLPYYHNPIVSKTEVENVSNPLAIFSLAAVRKHVVLDNTAKSYLGLDTKTDEQSKVSIETVAYYMWQY